MNELEKVNEPGNEAIRRSCLKFSTDIDQLAPAIVAFQGETENPKASSDNPYYHSRYADLAEIRSTIRPTLHKHGLCIIQAPSVRHVPIGQAGDVHTYVNVVTRLMHSSGQWIEMEIESLCRDMARKGDERVDPKIIPSVQAIGSCTSYLRRYSVNAILGLAQEDDDGNGASGRDGEGNGGSNGNGAPIGAMVCKLCGATTVLKDKSSDEHFCWKAKGGCGSRFENAAEASDPVKYILHNLGEMFKDESIKSSDVNKFMQPRSALARFMSKEDQETINAAYTKLKERFPAQAGATPPPAKAPAGTAPTDDFKASLELVNGFVRKISASKTLDELANVESDYFEKKDGMAENHQGIVEKNIGAHRDHLKKSGKK